MAKNPPSQSQLDDFSNQEDKHLEPCCDHCREQVEREPQKARLIFAACAFDTKVADYQGDGTLNWD